jgi:pyruvate/2-oxoglutarate dehydrogenase complex dihydrolipoamide dehydrogenase (E3) component
MPTQYDAIIIGAGQSGPFLAVRLAEAGRKVVLIEREHIGGTCVNNGCIPTKTMVASARAAHVARDGARFGVNTGPVSVDYARVKARKDEIVAGSVKSLVDWLAATKGLTTIMGEAKFTGPHEVEVNGERLAAPQIFLNTGGRPVLPDWVGDVPHLTNESMMDLEVLPRHLVIVGGSYIGLEFAQMFRRFGSEVTVIEHGERLIAREDADVSDTVRQILEGEGIKFHFKARGFSAAKDGNGIALSFAGQTVRGSHMLVATGRAPNSDALALEAAGVAVDARGYITVDDRLETNVPGIFAMGDVNGRGAFTHTSYNDFEIVAANLLDGGDRKLSDRIAAHNLYIDPPLGRVGMSETEVRAKGIKALKGVFPMCRVGRAKERGETQGFMKVLVDAETRQILGAALLGIEADEVVQSFLAVMMLKAPYTTITRTMYIHPTVTELVPSAFAALQPLE